MGEAARSGDGKPPKGAVDALEKYLELKADGIYPAGPFSTERAPSPGITKVHMSAAQN
jgi:hypothetical protein